MNLEQALDHLLKKAVEEEADDDRQNMEAIVAIARSVTLSLRRIADALEKAYP